MEFGRNRRFELEAVAGGTGSLRMTDEALKLTADGRPDLLQWQVEGPAPKAFAVLMSRVSTNRDATPQAGVHGAADAVVVAGMPPAGNVGGAGMGDQCGIIPATFTQVHVEIDRLAPH